MKIEFNEAEHLYTIDGVHVPSVTQVIKEAIGCGWEAGQWYLDRGRAIHACAEMIYHGKNFKFDERLAGYIEALKKFFAEVKPSPLGDATKPELLVGSKVYGFCGTIDLPCRINGKTCIIDYKHSMDKVRIPLQLGGYSIALEETFNLKAMLGYGVQIKDNGTYQMSEAFDLRRSRYEFLALRTTCAIKARCGDTPSQNGD